MATKKRARRKDTGDCSKLENDLKSEKAKVTEIAARLDALCREIERIRILACRPPVTCTPKPPKRKK
jgi:hypothetical protein